MERSAQARADLARIDEYLERFAKLVGAPIAPLDPEGSTRVQRGAAVVGVNVLADKGFLLLLAPMPTPPARSAAEPEAHRALLEWSYLRTEEAAFAVDRETGRVYLRALRSLDLLDFDQFCELLDTVARLADELAGQLRARFGGA